MNNKEYEVLISKFYDLDVEKKKKEVFEELEKTKKILDIVLQFQENPVSNDLVRYDENAIDSESDNLVKVYNAERCICDMLRSEGEFDLELHNRRYCPYLAHY